MEEKPRRSPRIQLSIPIRVRGMSLQHKFFDEETATILVSKYGIMTQIRNLVDLEAEVHVVNLSNEISGTFRAVWVNTQVKDGFYQMGLEVIEAAGNIWGIFFPPEDPAIDEPTAQAWLECKNCHQKLLGQIPQAEVEHLVVGVVVARQCDRCRATTTWQLTIEDEHADAAVEKAPRTKTRAALRVSIKVMREVEGAMVEDVCETLNVSRNGAYFLTAKNYEVGESLKIILPYKKGDATRPASAIVTRQDQVEGPFNHGVGIHIETEVSVPGLARAESETSEPILTKDKKIEAELRAKGRVPLKMPIKVIRNTYGMTLEDVGETTNISRTGAYFESSQNYAVGEIVQVILPFKKGQQPIPVPARVVRLDQHPGSYVRSVALHMEADKK
jgi:PilZ domain-containing protein